MVRNKDNPEGKEQTPLKELVGNARFHLANMDDEQLAKAGYKREVHKPNQQQIDYFHSIGRPKVLSFTPEQKWAIVTNKILEYCKGKFQPDKYNLPLIQELFQYFHGVSNELDNSKGLYLYGPVGSGKTTIIKAFLSVPWVDIEVDKWIETRPKEISCPEIINQINHAAKEEDTTIKYMHGDWHFDDLAAERPHKYATKDSEPIMGDILFRRLSKIDEAKTYITSNYPMDLIENKYELRVASRVEKSCNIILLAGEDKRKIKADSATK